MIHPLPLSIPEGVSLKDPALVHFQGTYHLVCSWFYGENFSKLTAWRSRDLESWEGPVWELGEGTRGFCSPDIIRHGEQWIMTFQSWDALPPRQSLNQIFYSTSVDLAEWSAPFPLAAELTHGKRAIDAALAMHAGRWYLIYKEAQQPRLATAASLEGPWTQLGPPVDQWIENAQLLRIDGHWHLYATLVEHRQGLTRMVGDGSRPEDWSFWEPFRIIDTPSIPGFNRGMPANAGCLWDDSAASGTWLRAFCAAELPAPSNFGYTLGMETDFRFPTP